ncbi:MAG: selenocysteine-specific translation elongation factor [Candidatus Marinimicrobia bacterium]|jgi:selenocysteine-specific elongation factor|nr:selenocysteine-specific translation elongation factor [Candidatus Neomarinimicrobiota bacterium]MBT3634145.1 selenocysteine-specific translation elongation factor [Candidatus Neomarinimicrobiota bacterium]MBT3683182.1 selenocysteine-specific translation elongation factor [Candidatus Neomarinimicrobiota bacterium]MBT3759770.1 selenocysteine-specific translation elongation factor [Candidatus Neomarinimicrobiota bacterium]MBT3895824.1 selenocysteine-specific translation elongation factor [Candi
MKQVVVGLAGHIDHGKTALVKALTGVNTDRLEEEIRRGMTIDIGFAFLSNEITLIDVPGHEKFVKNMMAGVSAVDAAILVIAADDGVMPQSREHLDILKLLNIHTGCIVINKIDMVDDEWLELVESDINDLVQGSFLENTPIIRTSATNGVGIDSLRNSITEICSSLPTKQDNGIFRMNVDRVFTIKGFGTVTTGTVSSGKLKSGQTIDLLPQGKTLKVRGLQSHTQTVEQVKIGDRAAINLSNIEKVNLGRGNVIAEPGYFLPSRQIGAYISVLENADKPIIQNQRIRIHTGTQEVMGRVAIINSKVINPGDSYPVIVRLENAIVTSFNEKFIVRSYSPVVTIGGGQILANLITDKWKISSVKIESLFHASEEERIKIELASWKSLPLDEQAVKYTFNMSLECLDQKISSNDDVYWIRYKTDRWMVTKQQMEKFEKSITEFLKDFHSKFRYRLGPQKEEIRQAVKANSRFLEFVLDKMLQNLDVNQTGEIIHLPGHSIQLSSDEEKLMAKLLTYLNTEKFTSSGISDLAKNTGETDKKVKLLLDIAEQQGLIIRLIGRLLFTRENFEELKGKIRIFLKDNDILTVTDFKEMAGTSRKYAMPLLEYFDKLKITSRVEGGRILYD